MNWRPILFSTPMVRAILQGHKTMTRRVVTESHSVGKKNKSAPAKSSIGFVPSADPQCWIEQWLVDLTVMRPNTKPTTMNGNSYRCPYGQVGDRLWVRETWTQDTGLAGDKVHYKTDGEAYSWRPSIFMPRWASRITLEIISIKVERLQGITEGDAKKEGAGCSIAGILPATYRECFETLWDSINGKTYPWSSNPWCWVIEFVSIKEGR